MVVGVLETKDKLIRFEGRGVKVKVTARSYVKKNLRLHIGVKYKSITFEVKVRVRIKVTVKVKVKVVSRSHISVSYCGRRKHVRRRLDVEVPSSYGRRTANFDNVNADVYDDDEDVDVQVSIHSS